jgi:hypothetical protein
MPTMRHGRWLRSTPACLVGVLSLTGAIAVGQPPGVAIATLVASNSGIADITQQQRLAAEIAAAVSQAINQHMPLAPR